MNVMICWAKIRYFLRDKFMLCTGRTMTVYHILNDREPVWEEEKKTEEIDTK